MHQLSTNCRNLFLLLALVASVQSLSCYSYAGREHINQKKCANSNACCSENDECLSNRLCKSSGVAANLLVRGTCLSSPWDDSCAQICDFKEEEQNTGFPVRRFPQVEVCDEGVYCCRFGNKPCCDQEDNWVFLDEDGVRVSARPSTTGEVSGSASEESDASSTETEETTSTRSVESTSTPSELPPTTTDSANKTQESDSRETDFEGAETNKDKVATDDNVGLKAGLGVGIPVAAGLAGLGAWWFFRRRREKTAVTAEPSELPQEQYKGYVEYNGSPGMQTVERSELSGWNGNVPYELAGSEPQHSRGY
ncbi:hypothetical protein LIA77_06680 [Sarocladium implicatum]|nr:hypothetical protein LIA77_06680 [Sarocladium implicatum]